MGLSGPWAGNALAFSNGNRTVIVLNNPLKSARELIIKIDNKAHAFKAEPESFNTIEFE